LQVLDLSLEDQEELGLGFRVHGEGLIVDLVNSITGTADNGVLLQLAVDSDVKREIKCNLYLKRK
jgi:hypothetical protein